MLVDFDGVLLAKMFTFLFFINNIAFSTDTDCKYPTVGYEYFLGTKTPYRLIANWTVESFEVEGCTPLKLVGIVRHGTRTPGKKFMAKLENLHVLKNTLFQSAEAQQKVSLCEEEKNKLKEWIGQLEVEGEEVLTHEGEEEMIQLAERLQKRFPRILPKEYSNDSFFFQFTDTQRARESAKYFTIGLFGRNDSYSVWFPTPVYKDPILRFYKLCDRWRKEVKKNPATYNELEKYKVKKEILLSIENISSTLGLNFTLKYDDVLLMYKICSFETAWNKNASPWCSLFSEHQLKIFEYAEDLKYYLRDGYGHHLNYKQACPAVKNIVSLLKEEGNKNVFYFTHSGTILKLLSHFGLYKDPFTLAHDTTEELKQMRKWRVSLIDTFGANLVFALFNCKGEKKVLTLHQERVVKIRGCSRNELCPLRLLEHILYNSLEKCNFNKFCSLHD